MFTVYRSPIGNIKIVGTDSYISALEFINDIDTSLQTTSSSVLDECHVQLEEYFSGKRKMFTIPVQQKGTPFQQAVWTALQTIPYGETVSYMVIANMLNNAQAVRAVGAANGQNKIPILIPCHRVIGSNGKMVGYAYGVERKKLLLEHENPQLQQSLLFD